MDRSCPCDRQERLVVNGDNQTGSPFSEMDPRASFLNHYYSRCT